MTAGVPRSCSMPVLAVAPGCFNLSAVIDQIACCFLYRDTGLIPCCQDGMPADQEACQSATAEAQVPQAPPCILHSNKRKNQEEGYKQQPASTHWSLDLFHAEAEDPQFSRDRDAEDPRFWRDDDAEPPPAHEAGSRRFGDITVKREMPRQTTLVLMSSHGQPGSWGQHLAVPRESRIHHLEHHSMILYRQAQEQAQEACPAGAGLRRATQWQRSYRGISSTVQQRTVP